MRAQAGRESASPIQHSTVGPGACHISRTFTQYRGPGCVSSVLSVASTLYFSFGFMSFLSARGTVRAPSSPLPPPSPCSPLPSLYPSWTTVRAPSWL